MKWNHIILEGFCTRKISCKKGKYVYKVTNTKTWEREKIPNQCYDSTYKTPRKPSYCKDKITQDCFFKNCPFLAMGEPPEGDYKKIMKSINNIYVSLKDKMLEGEDDN